MKYLFTAIILLNFVSISYADENSCKQDCRKQADTCLDKAFAVKEEKYIDLMYLSEELENKELNQLYDNVNSRNKELKAACRKEQKECKAACEQE